VTQQLVARHTGDIPSQESADAPVRSIPRDRGHRFSDRRCMRWSSRSQRRTERVSRLFVEGQ
jgi:hypothetical protein